MKRFVIAIALTCVLSGSAFAGEMPIGGFAPPPPPPPDSSSATTSGDMPCDGSATPSITQEPGLASISATEAALDLLQTVLSLI